MRSEAASLDPHWTQLSADLQVQEHIFEHLVDLDSNSQTVPGLAVSWAPIDETTWEFKLREGVTWHDGEPFNADDVIFSFDVPNRVKKARVLGTRVSDKTPPPGQGLWPSDHGSVAADLRF